ncbi:Dabb family protein [Neolewinella lacunae]|uniref:Dabb family protein n=1 Tax=Neolewinella lacunae TaxID=1517758 RepID=A0A923T7H2_9BACT|nr:Dabb family protein [Neolewinella lacunae]MBC6992863.1 Dabb family protein [Neolewinella lacunae]MDN3633773.1 Dabb family protein [Neolewinella lacunae]
MSEQRAGLIHTVYFWLQPDLDEAARRDFEQGVARLAAVPGVLHFYAGPPAKTIEREVTDHSFDYSLHLFFADVAAQEHYQDHPIHLQFVAEQAAKFATVKVYDNAL